MSLYAWLNKRGSRSKRPRRPQTVRPWLEALEDRLVLATLRVWTGGSILSNHWSDQFNWQNGTPQPGDSVLFPADANQRTNVQDLDLTTSLSGGLHLAMGALNNLHIAGGDYDIDGAEIDLTGKLTSDADNNTIHSFLAFLVNPVDTIDVGSGSLTLTGDVAGTLDGTSCVVGSPSLVKTGAGTLKVSSTVGVDVSFTDLCPFSNDPFDLFTIQQGLLSLEGGQVRVDLHVEDGGTVRVNDGGDQITGPGRLPNVTVDAGGLIDLNTHVEGLGNLTLNGGKVTSTSTGALNLESDVTTTASATAAEIDGRVNLGASRAFNVADGTAADDLIINGVIQGTNFGLTKNGFGQLTLLGANNNTYSGETVVNGGILRLAKTLGARSISGPLTIGNGGGGTNADRVILSEDEQISNTIVPRINSSGLLALFGNTETLGGLTLAGGNVTTDIFVIGGVPRLGLLTLLGDVTTEASSASASITGHVSVGDGVRVFTVANGAAATDLAVNAVISNGGLTKTGAGTMELTANSPYASDTTINQGTLRVNGTLSDSLVRLTAGTLTGNGSVDGINATNGKIAPGDDVGTLTSTASVTLQSAVDFAPQVSAASGDPHDVLKVQGKVFLNGASLSVQPTFLNNVSTASTVIDDTSSSFTSTGGFQAFTGQGFGFFGDSVHFAAGTGTGSATEQATWNFQNIPPGSYRVSAFWVKDPNRATNAPFTLLNGTTPVTTVSVNQQLAPNDFSASGVRWKTLGVVQVTGNSLTVKLTNAANGFVIADAILIEPHQMVIVDNDDNNDAVQGNFAGLSEGATVTAIASTTINGQPVKQTQFYKISYRANDGNDVSLAYLNTGTAAQELQITPASINEGQTATLTGHLTDPDDGDFLTLTIDWGDGSRIETHHPGTAAFDFGHRYLNNPAGQPHGAYTVHLTWFDQHGAGNSRDLSITVNNVPPTIVLPGDVILSPSGLLVVAGHLSDAGVNDGWTATVDYGDGTGVQPLDVNPGQRFLLQHLYVLSGTYVVTVTITDSDGEFAIETFLVQFDALPHP